MMNKRDYVEKIFFIVCVTFLGILFAFFKFGGIEEMNKTSCSKILCGILFWATAACGAIFLIGTVTVIILSCGGSKDDNIASCDKTSTRCFTKAADWNKSYWIDNSNLDNEIPKDRTIIFIKDGIDLKNIKFSAPNKIEEIHFCDTEISIPAKMLVKLKKTTIFLDCGKTKIEISNDAKQKNVKTSSGEQK